jgi:hypothetical protein
MTEDEREMLRSAAASTRRIEDYLFARDTVSGASRSEDIDEIIQGKRTVRVVAKVFVWCMRTVAVIGAGVTALIFLRNGGNGP